MHTHSIQTRALSICAIILCLPIQPLATIPSANATELSNIIIEEVAWAGSSTSIADEWIELANLGDAEVNIGGWIVKGAGSSGQDLTIPEGAMIPAHETYLIANYEETNEKSSLISPVQFVTTIMSISNSELNIKLFDANQQLIDQVGNENAPFAGSASPFASMIRNDATLSGDQNAAWIPATSSIGFKEGVIDFGTPGICDRYIETNPGEEEETTPNESDEASTSTETIIEPSTDEAISDDESSDETVVTDITETSETPSTINDATASSTTMTSDAATSTVEIINEETGVETSSTSSSSRALYPVPRTPVFLNEIISNPTTGSEWIELEFPDHVVATNRELWIYDNQSK